MTAERWARIKEIFQEAAERDRVARGDYLAVACGSDAELREAVERLLAAHDSAGRFLDSPVRFDRDLVDGASVATEDPPPTHIGPYRVVRELGRGGMGTVYLAERDDPDLRRTVAIKVVNVASPSLVRRFRTETGVLAGLEHPGIARLYDAGTTPSGVPYLVMEFVDGQDLLRYCDGRHAPIGERLRLFQRVCAAVQYAHQNFIVHRDLKPSNILVTAEGEPKLLDFGIAKLVSGTDGTADETAMFARILTPQYSSPEQIRGDRVTTASDVYSLGVVLYELLCGSRPYHVSSRTPAGIERTVTEQDPPRPSLAVAGGEAAAARATPAERLRSQLHGDLDNIVLKALQKDPANRYATAADLAEDIQRHLEGYPVHAQAATAAQRAAKFLRRHRAPVAAASLAVLALVAGLALALWQAHVARLERDRARQRLWDVQRLANTLIFKIHDGVQALPNSTPVRRMIIAEALTYLEALRNDPAADETLRIELAQAYQRIGIVQGQGNVANLGDRKGAIVSFNKALDILRPLMVNPPAHKNAAIQFGRTALSLATTEWAAGEHAQAEVAVKEAEKVAESLVAVPSADDDAKRLLASVHFQYALLTSSQESVAHWNRALVIFDALLAARPDDPDRQRNVALVHKYLGSLYDDAHDSASALVHHSRARELDAKRLARNPSDRQALSDVAIDLGNIARAQIAVGTREEAIASFEQSLAIRQQIADADPHDVFAQGRVAFAHMRLADLYAAAGNTAVSLEHARTAARIDEALGTLDSTHRAELAEAWMVLGEAEARAGGLPAACRLYRKSRATFLELPNQKLTDAQDATRHRLQARIAGDLTACPPDR